jgi:hypothetical protein
MHHIHSRLLIVAALAVFLSAGCANGWPHTHHLAPPKAAAACTPTGSRIAREGCTTDNPTTSTSQAEFDRQGLGPGGTPMQSQGTMPLPR